MRAFLTSTLVGALALLTLHAQADTLQVNMGDSCINVEAKQILLLGAPQAPGSTGEQRFILRAIGDAHVVLPPTTSGKTGNRTNKQKSALVEDSTKLPVTLDAQTIEVTYPAYSIKACGGVVFRQGSKTLFASELAYDYDTQNGTMVQAQYNESPVKMMSREINVVNGDMHMLSASATTCDKPNPDYHISAKEIILTRDKVLKAKGVTLWLGKTKIISLPVLTTSLKGGRQTRSFFPQPGYNRKDGFTMGLGIPLVDNEKFLSDLFTKYTTRRSFQVRSTSEYLLSGKSDGVLLPVKTLAETELRDRAPLIPQRRDTDIDIDTTVPNEKQLRLFLDASSKERIYDIQNDDLLLNKEPEIGLRYIVPGLRLSNDNDIPGLHSEGKLSWGRFKENWNPRTYQRVDGRIFLAPTLAKLRNNWYIMPVALGRASHYDNGDNYYSLGLGADLTKVLAPGTFGTLRYINHLVSGRTPLQFDNVDVRSELQTILQYRTKSDLYALALRYDLDNSELYDWQVTYGHTFHCLEPRISWRNRFSLIHLDVKVLGF